MRLFVGYRLPPPVIESILSLQEQLRSKLGAVELVRWIARENLHITTVFLGRVEERKLRFIKQVLINTVLLAKYNRQIKFAVRHCGAWPKGRTARIIALHLDHPAAYAQLQARLAAKFAPNLPHMGRLRPAHITIGRIGAQAPVEQIQKIVQLSELLYFPWKKITVNSLTLFRSILSPRGSNYQVLWPDKQQG